MGNKKSIKRLIASGFMMAFTLISLVTTTYAFVTLSTEASISDFSIDIVDQEGLLISTDGKVFFQDIDYSIIKKAILANKTATSLKDIKLQGVTLGGRSNANEDLKAGLYTEDYTYQYNENTITDKRLTFIKDDVTWLDINKPSDALAISSARENATIDNILNENDRVGIHNYEMASYDDYIFFDLWLSVAQNGDYHPNYKLKFSDRTVIEGESQEVELFNSLETIDASYKKGDKIIVNPKDAFRLGVNVISSANDTSYSNINDNLKIFEPNEGLGSYAVEGIHDVSGRDSNLFNPQKNAMYTYYNNLNPLAPFTNGVIDNGQLNTLTNKENASGDSIINDETLAQFKYTNGSYNVVKMTVMIWLEGWDADYFVGINNKAISVKLGFEIVEEE